MCIAVNIGEGCIQLHRQPALHLPDRSATVLVGFACMAQIWRLLLIFIFISPTDSTSKEKKINAVNTK